MGINWSLECCNDKQLLSIFLIICYAVVIFKLYHPPQSLHLLLSCT